MVLLPFFRVVLTPVRFVLRHQEGYNKSNQNTDSADTDTMEIEESIKQQIDKTSRSVTKTRPSTRSRTPKRSASSEEGGQRETHRAEWQQEHRGRGTHQHQVDHQESIENHQTDETTGSSTRRAMSSLKSCIASSAKHRRSRTKQDQHSSSSSRTQTAT